MDVPILEPVYTRQDGRGIFQEVIRGFPWQTVIVGHMHKDCELGHHYHLETLLFFFLTTGAVAITIVNVETGERNHQELNRGQGVLLAPKQAHVIRFRQESDFILLKSLSYDPENPDTFHYPVSK